MKDDVDERLMVLEKQVDEIAENVTHVMAEQSGPFRRCEMRQMEYRIPQKLQGTSWVLTVAIMLLLFFK